MPFARAHPLRAGPFCYTVPAVFLREIDANFSFRADPGPRPSRSPKARLNRGGFEQSYNAQAGVDTETMMVITRHVSQAPNDKREVVPTLAQILALSAVLGKVQSLITDNGFCSQANVIACIEAKIEPLLALKMLFRFLKRPKKGNRI